MPVEVLTLLDFDLPVALSTTLLFFMRPAVCMQQLSVMFGRQMGCALHVPIAHRNCYTPVHAVTSKELILVAPGMTVSADMHSTLVCCTVHSCALVIQG